jgi:hypothetical protein
VIRLAALAPLLLAVLPPGAGAHAADPRPAVPTLEQVAEVSPGLRGGEDEVVPGPRSFTGLATCQDVTLPRPESVRTAQYSAQGRPFVSADVAAFRMASASDARRVVAQLRRAVRDCPEVVVGDPEPQADLTDLTGRARGVGQQRVAFRLGIGERVDGVFVGARRGRTLVLTDVVRLGRGRAVTAREAFDLAELALRVAG